MNCRNRSSTASCTLRVAIFLMATRCSLSLPFCSEQPLSIGHHPDGELVTVDEAETWCDGATGTLHYSWNVAFSGELFRQLEVHCYSGNNLHTGTWEIVQPRTLDTADGSASYSIPPDFLDDISITSCKVQGCYETYGGTSVYLTNNVSVSCRVPDPPTTDEVVTVSATTGRVMTTPRPLATGTKTLASEFGPSVSLFPSAPSQRGGVPLQSVFIISAVAIVMAIICCVPIAIFFVRQSQHRRKSVWLPFYEEEKFDLDKTLPILGPIPEEIPTPYPSIYSLIEIPGLFTAADPLPPPISGVGGERGNSGGDLTQMSLPISESESHSGGQGSLYGGQSSVYSEGDGKTDANTAGSSSTGCGVSDEGVPVEIGYRDLVHEMTELIPDERQETVEVDDNEITGAGVDEGGGSEEQNRDCFSSHFISELSSGTSSSGGTGSSSQYQTSCSSGYVTDTSGPLFSPSSLSGNPALAAVKHETKSSGSQLNAESLEDERMLAGKVDTDSQVDENLSQDAFGADCKRSEQKLQQGFGKDFLQIESLHEQGINSSTSSASVVPNKLGATDEKFPQFVTTDTSSSYCQRDNNPEDMTDVQNVLLDDGRGFENSLGSRCYIELEGRAKYLVSNLLDTVSSPAIDGIGYSALPANNGSHRGDTGYIHHYT